MSKVRGHKTRMLYIKSKELAAYIAFDKRSRFAQCVVCSTVECQYLHCPAERQIRRTDEEKLMEVRDLAYLVRSISVSHLGWFDSPLG